MHAIQQTCITLWSIPGINHEIGIAHNGNAN